MKHRLLFGLLLLHLTSVGITLSDSARVSLLTCKPGRELYSCFGHSGVRVTDYKQGFDVVFNYGTFDFNKPNFYLNFCRGILVYMVGVDRFEDFKQQYIWEERTVYEQELQMSIAAKQKMFMFLDHNAQPENRDYRYDFLNDNCATRILDVIEKNSGGKLDIDFNNFEKERSFRYFIDKYSLAMPWARFGMNLLIGLPVDRTISPRQHCFLPDFLSLAVSDSKLDGRVFSKPVELLLLAPEIKKDVSPFYMTPLFWVVVLLFIALSFSFIEWKGNRYVPYFDWILFPISSLLGLLFLVLWFFTQHTTTTCNLNLLWALPTNLVFLFFIKKNWSWVATYFLGAGCLALLGGFLLPLSRHLAVGGTEEFFIALAIAIRCFSIAIQVRKKTLSTVN